MKLYFSTIFFLLLVFKTFSQQNTFQGTYEDAFGKNTEGPYQYLEIHYSNPATILFYLEVGRGAPSYNSGALFGCLTLNKTNGHLQYIPKDSTQDCTLDFLKKGNSIVITTLQGECGFGGGCYADGTYYLVTKSNPKYFIGRTGKKYRFRNTKPEDKIEY